MPGAMPASGGRPDVGRPAPLATERAPQHSVDVRCPLLASSTATQLPSTVSHQLAHDSSQQGGDAGPHDGSEMDVELAHSSAVLAQRGGCAPHKPDAIALTAAGGAPDVHLSTTAAAGIAAAAAQADVAHAPVALPVATRPLRAVAQVAAFLRSQRERLLAMAVEGGDHDCDAAPGAVAPQRLGGVRGSAKGTGSGGVQQAQRMHAVAIARVFHGLSSPRYPGDQWRRCGFWGRFAAWDFRAIVDVARPALQRFYAAEGEGARALPAPPE
jgi:hypothetical protein